MRLQNRRLRLHTFFRVRVEKPALSQTAQLPLATAKSGMVLARSFCALTWEVALADNLGGSVLFERAIGRTAQHRMMRLSAGAAHNEHCASQRQCVCR
jgi:hypothetical protein